jgi:hypothetical protein
VAEVADFGSKLGIGKTGVHLRYHNSADYKALSKAKQDELREWRKQHPQSRGERGGKSDAKKRFKPDKKAMTAAIQKGVETQLAALAREAKKEQEGGLLMELLVEAVGRKNQVASSLATPDKKAMLHAILKKAQSSVVP